MPITSLQRKRMSDEQAAKVDEMDMKFASFNFKPMWIGLGYPEDVYFSIDSIRVEVCGKGNLWIQSPDLFEIFKWDDKKSDEDNCANLCRMYLKFKNFK